MKARTQLVAALFGAGRPSGALGAPGDADSRWRAATFVLKHRPGAATDASKRDGLMGMLRRCVDRFVARRC